MGTEQNSSEIEEQDIRFDTIAPDLKRALATVTQMIYLITDEEDRFLVQLHAILDRDRRLAQEAVSKGKEVVKRPKKSVYVFDYGTGYRELNDVTGDWVNFAYKSGDPRDVNATLTKVFQDKLQNEMRYYVFLDAERIFKDEVAVRHILNISHQLNQNPVARKVLIFVGSRRNIPDKLQRYFQVVYDNLPGEAEIAHQVETIVRGMEQVHNERRKERIRRKMATAEDEAEIKIDVPSGIISDFHGLTSWEIRQALKQSIHDNRRSKVYAISREHIMRYKRDQINKTELLQFVDVSGFDFDQVGGVQKFKDWVQKVGHTWTEEGRAFGLKPPKGVLAIGVWGCGKSLSVKAMGKAWNLPVIQLEMGKLRSSLVGQSEANVYRALRIIESVGDCIVWIDEAEKTFAGAHSSSHSDAGTTSRTIGILSTWMQERQNRVCVAMTANSVTTLPVEFVNRLDERFFFDLPTEEERIDILKIHLRKMGQDPANYDLDLLARKSVNLVGREIEQAIQAAMVDSFVAKKPALDGEILVRILRTKPRIVNTMVDELRETLDWVGYDRDADEGIRARFASSFHRWRKKGEEGDIQILEGGSDD